LPYFLTRPVAGQLADYQRPPIDHDIRLWKLLLHMLFRSIADTVFLRRLFFGLFLCMARFLSYLFADRSTVCEDLLLAGFQPDLATDSLRQRFAAATQRFEADFNYLIVIGFKPVSIWDHVILLYFFFGRHSSVPAVRSLFQPLEK
jgi:hypothetical protein